MLILEPFGLEKQLVSLLKVDLNMVWERELGSRGRRRESSHLHHYSIYGVSSPSSERFSVTLHQMDWRLVDFEAGKRIRTCLRRTSGLTHRDFVL
jgi:hypothetical protein